MAFISQEIPHFNSGISQQPPVLRSPEQLAEQLNCLSSEADGLIKRSPTVLKKYLNSMQLATENILFHTVKRDDNEKYLMLLDGESLVVMDADGNEKTVVINEGSQYIKTSNPRRDLRILTVADYSFILNKAVKTEMSTEVSPNSWSEQGLLVNVKSGQYGHTYKILINGTQIASYTTPDGSDSGHVSSITTDNIASNLATQCRNAGYSVITGSSWLYIYGVTISSFACYDGYDDSGMIGIHKAVSKFTNLPRTAPYGFTVKVQGEIASNADDYYVYYDSTDTLWKECACPDLAVAFNAATMPHALISNADGTFTLEQVDWDKRLVGDDDSNEIPSFIGSTISDIFFFRNRLGFISGENVILSESSSFFNFWMSTATNVLDTDVIDVSVSHTSLIQLKHAVVFTEVVILTSDKAQFLLYPDGVLSPKSVRVDLLTEYPCGSIARPVVAGRRFYYTSDRSNYTTVRELYTAGTIDDAKLTNDVSTHIQQYIPTGVYNVVANNIENMILIATEGKPQSLFIYKYLFAEEKRLQSSWSEWSIGEGNSILGLGLIDDALYLIVKRNGQYSLEVMSMATNTKDFEIEPYRVYADQKQVVELQYDSIKEETPIDIATIFNLDADNMPNKKWCVITPDKRYIQIDRSELVNGVYYYQHILNTVIVGEIFDCYVVLSPILISTDKGKITNGRLQLRYITFNYANSWLFAVEVITATATTNTVMTGKQIGNSVISRLEGKTGNFRVPIQSQNTSCEIKVTSNNPLPFNIISAIWEGIFYQRSRRL